MNSSTGFGTVSGPDLRAIRTILEDVELGFNNKDSALMNAHLADDAVVVTARGAVLEGRLAIENATREALASDFLRDATAYYQLADVVALSVDVISARKDAWSTQESAEDGRAPEMNALYIFVRRSGRWLIWRRQNTMAA
ncbi:DUF4440 domain-containing protein [Rhodococcus sp. 14-2470-1b]|jgi:uncharacterized protein (TIGR02246 family)|uniref:YybH family protein n=1 Tax=Rhodococcus sp. 14-2470-1b TaxID=2023149 RepID=UPI000B9BD4E9|nr:SgcJ/EcaC family oxidoreductase [Rhodococcus sp. 14-2470-1b]OZF53688.1 DUF4440 domain-containing protein [Rhodococcus sp. 14-2470-1b]